MSHAIHYPRGHFDGDAAASDSDLDMVEEKAIEEFLGDGELLTIAEHWAKEEYSDAELVEQFRKLLSQHTSRVEESIGERTEDDYAEEHA
jgi:hypothetical protein